MSLQVGDAAPQFELPTDGDGVCDLAGLAG